MARPRTALAQRYRLNPQLAAGPDGLHRSLIRRTPPFYREVTPLPRATAMVGHHPESTVFVVDDDASVRQSISRLLRAEGLRSETFQSARIFLDDAEPRHPCCLLLDLRMPGLDGLGLQQRLGSSRLSMPTIFMTGYASVPVSVEVGRATADDRESVTL